MASDLHVLTGDAHLPAEVAGAVTDRHDHLRNHEGSEVMRRHRSTCPTYATVPDAVRYLASACDGARCRDGHGFGAEHVAVGHWLAAQPDQVWGRGHLSLGRTLVAVYRRQLETAGFEPEAILYNLPPRRRHRHEPEVFAAWAPDPTGRAEYRWWIGARWTAHIASAVGAPVQHSRP